MQKREPIQERGEQPTRAMKMIVNVEYSTLTIEAGIAQVIVNVEYSMLTIEARTVIGIVNVEYSTLTITPTEFNVYVSLLSVYMDLYNAETTSGKA